MLLALCSLLFALCSLAQEPVDTVETWEGGGLAGWTCGSSQATLSCVTNTEPTPNAYLNLRFGAQTMAAFEEDVARTPVSRVLITNVSFRFFSATIFPSAVRLYLHSSESGNSWYVNLPAPAAGAWTAYDVPVDFSGRWIMGPVGGREAFLRDMRSIDWVGVYVRRHGDTAAQNYGLDDFRIRGVTIPDSASICGVVLYEGEQGGPIWVRAFSAGVNGVQTGATVSVAGPGAYEISRLPFNRDYTVSAFRDSNSNSVPDFWEASGVWAGSPVAVASAGLSHVDIVLADPKNAENLPYWWLHRYFNVTGVTTNLFWNGDSDGDGTFDGAEYRAGTDPRDAKSQFELAIGVTNETGGVGIVLWWNSVPRRTYVVWRSTDLVAGFTRLEQGIPSTPPMNMYRDNTATNAGPYFYRIDVEP